MFRLACEEGDREARRWTATLYLVSAVPAFSTGAGLMLADWEQHEFQDRDGPRWGYGSGSDDESTGRR